MIYVTGTLFFFSSSEETLFFRDQLRERLTEKEKKVERRNTDIGDFAVLYWQTSKSSL